MSEPDDDLADVEIRAMRDRKAMVEIKRIFMGAVFS
jgi:hypothetical protein